MIATLKFAAGFLSNILCQTPRMAGSLLLCLLFAVMALANLVLGTLRLVGGGHSMGMESVRESWRLLKLSARKGGECTAQAISLALLVGPLVRASQACSESIFPAGLYVPSDPERSRIQDVLGWNSWNPQPTKKAQQQSAPSRASQPETIQQDAPRRASQPETIQQSAPRRVHQPKRIKAKSRNDDRWDALSHAYMTAKSRREADRARISMFLKNPIRYCIALEVARSNCPRFKRKSGLLLKAG